MNTTLSIDHQKYDPEILAAALESLNHVELSSMLKHIADLEVQIKMLGIAGQESAMIRLVTNDLHRLTKFLNSVKSYKDSIGDTR